MDKVSIIWTEQALEDMDIIADYIAINSIHYAQITVTKLFDRTTILERFPKSGRIVPEINEENIRELIEGSYRILYEIKELNEAIRIEILGVHHSSIPL